MENLYLIETAIWNGAHKNVIDRSCVRTIDLANKTKDVVDDANKDSLMSTLTTVYPVHLYESEHEMPIFNPEAVTDNVEKKSHKQMAKELQERLVQCCIDYINENGDVDIQEVDFRADCLQASSKDEKWLPCTDSHITLSTYVKDEDGLGMRKIIGEYF